MTSEKATVIMPTYNHVKYLGSSISSILASETPVRLIIVPVSHDVDTMNYLQRLNDKLNGFFHNIAIIPSDKADVFHQMQLGLDNVETEFFTVFGSDDYMLPNMIGSMLEYVDGDENPIVGLSFTLTDANLKPLKNHILEPFDLDKMMKGSCIPDIALVSTQHARMVGGFKGDKDWGYLNHYAFYHRLLRLGNAEVKLKKEIGFLYRQLDSSRHSKRYKTRADIKAHRKKMREVSRYYWGE